MFLLSKGFFESDTNMKDPCITREQSTGIHGIVNDQGLQCIIGQFQTRSAYWKLSNVRINTAK